MKNIFKAFLLLLFFPSLTLAAPFCVGNFSGQKLSWNYRDPGRHVFEQEPDQQWQCAEFGRSDYPVEVFLAEHKFLSPSCFFTTKARDWVQVTVERINGAPTLKCTGFATDGPAPQVEMGEVGSRYGWRIAGTVMYGGSFKKGDVFLFTPDRKQYFAAHMNVVKADGSFAIEAPTAHLAGYAVQVVLDDGRQNNLYAIIPSGFDLEKDLIQVNAATTLASYLVLPERPLAKAEERVRNFLGLYEGMKLGDAGIHGLCSFSPAIFWSEARRYGGWDNFMFTLYQKMKDPKAVYVAPVQVRSKCVKRSYMSDFAPALLTENYPFVFNNIGNAQPIPDGENRLALRLENMKILLEEVKFQQATFEATIVKDSYDLRSREIEKNFAAIEDIYNSMRVQSALLQRFTVADFPKLGPGITATARITAQQNAEKLKTLAKNFISLVNANLQTSAEKKSMNTLFGEALYEKRGLMDEKYYEQLDLQLVRYQLMQLYASALWLDSLLAQGDKAAAQTMKKTYIEGMIQKEEAL
ncbi:hypothetical protein QJS83_15015 [Bdellovibrio sp. 22V]|uniref:hypothetical protein n=1 Tax=Bdellovibrio sp. 22V TaxID=3044166 RepID=UPI002543B290|nr:hypothetical protein [Bdellovibrio sp. 22V]WII71774.1 hypothetical protein QJS83_15015 [Bdellovibrio sp. 22V]